MFYKDAIREQMKAIVPGLMEECGGNRREVVLRLLEISKGHGDHFTMDELSRVVCSATKLDFDLVLAGKEVL